jgi:hypothetical protein
LLQRFKENEVIPRRDGKINFWTSINGMDQDIQKFKMEVEEMVGSREMIKQ